MAGVVNKICLNNYKFIYYQRFLFNITQYRKVTVESTPNEDEEFRVLELFPMAKQTKKVHKKPFSDAQVLPPREKRMPIDQDWVSVWPAAKTFRPSSVPLPVYQGYDQKRAPPGKYANAELMKIPNFLHLTPPAVKRHCAAIKQFCSEWPEGLETDEDIVKHFPVEIISSDYCHSSPTIRDERSRIVTLKINLNSLNLDYHGRDKLIRLVGPERYNKSNHMITMVADRCPTKKQNYDYLIYLLTAVHHESSITEPWEHEKTEADMEKFFFEKSRIQRKISETISLIESGTKPSDETTLENLVKTEKVSSFGEAVSRLINEGEDEEILMNYKKSVLNSLKLS